MQIKLQNFFARSTLALGLTLGAFQSAEAQTLPTAKEVAAQMSVGWNLGNTMEAIFEDELGNETPDHTAWGNDIPTAIFMDSLKAAGFKTLRIPAAWDGYADPSTKIISPDWFSKVKTVVDLAIARDMYVILNIHWDGGWLEDNITPEVQTEVNAKQHNYWTQIATYFKDYDEHLLFAGSNEPGQNYDDKLITAGLMSILDTYHQTFVDAVRATGGNNSSRTLIVQGPKTNIDFTDQLWNKMPNDLISDRLMLEVHFYPYSFTLMQEDANWGNAAYYWGQGNHSSTDVAHNSTWGEEAFVDSALAKMKTKFVDQNIPVVIGEFGAIQRSNLSGDDLILHLRSRKAFYQYVISKSIQNGMIPVLWDTGAENTNNMTVIKRETGEVFDVSLYNGIQKALGKDTIQGELTLNSLNHSMKILYSAKDSLWGQVNLGVAKANFSTYDSIVVKAYGNGQTTYDNNGEPAYGFVNLNLVTMSTDSWVWREASLGDLTFDAWENYSIPLSTDQSKITEALVPADPNQVNFFGLQIYSEAYNGTIYIDYIAFIDNEGQNDTLYTFDLIAPSEFSGNIEKISIIENSKVPNDQEWKTATQAKDGTTPVVQTQFHSEPLNFKFEKGILSGSFESQAKGTATLVLKNMLGQVIQAVDLQAEVGNNSFSVPANFSGAGILEIKIGEHSSFTQVHSF